MKHLFLFASFLFASVLSLRAQEEKKIDTSAWERSIVEIETNRKQYHYSLPWARSASRSMRTGIVVGERQILASADDLFDRTLVRLRKGGRGRWTIGQVAWVDYPANLALVTTSDEGFWTGLAPVPLSSTLGAADSLQVLRWRDGKLENRTAEFTQYTVREGQMAAVNHVHLEASSEIQGVGRGEPIIVNSHVVGIITGQAGRTIMAMPASFIQSILEAQKKGEYRGLGFFHFVWQPAENIASLAYLKLEGEPRGVLVIDVPNRTDGLDSALKRQDIILQIDGFDVDIQGDYKDPEFGPLMLENLSTRRKWAGDEVKIKVWRDGKPLDVTYRIPKFAYTNSLLADATYDQEPEYLIVGGLVFQPLTDSFLQIWGADWKRRAPFRLNYYNHEPVTKDRPALVILSQILPDAYNIGYQNLRYLVMDKVNGQRITRLPELREALQKPVDGFHIIHFVQTDGLRRMVLAAGDTERQATQRVLQDYNVKQDHFFASEKKDGAAGVLEAILDSAARPGARRPNQ